MSRIGEAAFYQASSLRNIIIPESVTSIGRGAFMYCEQLETYTIPENIISYSDSQFSYCTKLEEIRINSNVSELGYCCFQGCTDIKRIYFDSDIRFKSFNNYGCLTFKDCPNISSIYSNSRKPNGFSNLNVFESYVYLNTTLYIPKGTTQIYKETAGWKEFANIIETDLFEELPVYLTLKNADNGSIAQEVESGKTYSFIITPNEGWDIESVSFNGKNVTSQLDGNKYTTPAITSNSELNIVYKQSGASAVKSLKSESNVRVLASYGKLTIENADASTNLTVYSTSGSKVVSEPVGVGTTTIDLPTNSIYIIKVGEETFKVSM